MNTMTPTATLYVVLLGEDTIGVYQSEQDAKREIEEYRRTNPTARPFIVATPYYPTQAR